MKCVLLVAITTFRRCADIQALRLGKGWVSVQNRGIAFLGPGLSKQDRPGHLGSNVFVPSFPKNKKLDSKRTLYWYLKNTEQLRNNEDSAFAKPFLSYVKPHHPVSSKTRWKEETICLPYDDKHKKIKGHSTKAIGPSWALCNGTTVKAVLDAAD